MWPTTASNAEVGSGRRGTGRERWVRAERATITRIATMVMEATRDKRRTRGGAESTEARSWIRQPLLRWRAKPCGLRREGASTTGHSRSRSSRTVLVTQPRLSLRSAALRTLLCDRAGGAETAARARCGRRVRVDSAKDVQNGFADLASFAITLARQAPMSQFRPPVLIEFGHIPDIAGALKNVGGCLFDRHNSRPFFRCAPPAPKLLFDRQGLQ